MEIPEQQEIPECNALITKVEDGDKTVTFWMGEESITVAKVELVRFEILAGKLYFDIEETKKVNVDLTGVKSVMLMKSPKGWDVEFDGKVLTVTSPSEDAVWYDMTAVQYGDIEIWAATEDERLLVGTLKVEIPQYSAPVAISMGTRPDYEFEFIPGMDMMTYQMANARFGACKRTAFDAEAIYEKLVAGDESILSIMSAYGQYGTEDGTIKMTLAELLGETPVAGEEYIVWAIAPTTEVDYEIMDYVETFSMEEFIKVYVSPVFVNIEVKETTFDNATIAVNAEGVSKYFAGYLPASEYDEDSFDIQAYFNSSPGIGFNAPKGMWAYYSEAFEGKLSLFASPDYESPINVNSEYVLFVVPMDKGEDDVTVYTKDDITFARVKTDNIFPGGSSTVSVDTENASYDEIYPVITTDAILTYYRYYAVSESKPADDIKATPDSVFVAEILKVHNEGTSSETEENALSSVESSITATKYELTPGSEFVLVTVAVDAEGKYVVNKTDVAAKEIPYADELEIDITGTVAGPTNATMTLNITGDFSRLAVYSYEKNQSSDLDEESADFRLNVANNYPGNYSRATYIEATALTGDTYTLSGLALGKTYQILVVGITEDGKFSDVADAEATTALSDDAVVLASDPSYFQPEIGFDANKDGVLDGLYYSYDKGGLSPLFYAWYTIKGSDAAKVYYGTPYVNQISDADGNLLTGKALIEKVLSISQNEVSNPSEDYNYRFSSNWDYINGKNENVLWVMWTDADGKYYEPVILRTQQLARSIYSVADSKDYTFTATDNAVTPTKYVYKNFTVAAESTFYLRENAADDVKWGLATAGAVVAGTPATLVKSAEAQAFTLAAGTYNISFDIVANTLTVEAVE